MPAVERVTWLLVVMIVGTRQLGLAILMHEAARGGMHANLTRFASPLKCF
jgi:hypothetical protein